MHACRDPVPQHRRVTNLLPPRPTLGRECLRGRGAKSVPRASGSLGGLGGIPGTQAVRKKFHEGPERPRRTVELDPGSLSPEPLVPLCRGTVNDFLLAPTNPQSLETHVDPGVPVWTEHVCVSGMWGN